MSLLRYLPRFKAAKESLAELEVRESWSREQIAAYQVDRLNRLWADAIQHTPFYRELAKTNRLPFEFDSLSHFQSVYPILDKNLVRIRPRDFLSERAGKGKWYHSGGSTGKPASYFRSREAHSEILRRRYRSHAKWGVGLFDRWVYLWGHAASFSPGLKGHVERAKQPMLDWFRNRYRLSAYDLSTESLQKHLRRIARLRPAAIYAYSTAGYLLAKEAKAIGFRCPSLKLIVLTAEPVFPQIIKECEEAFGVPTLAEYGSAETSSLAFEAPDRTLRVFEDIFIVETPQREDGHYDVVITVLNSEPFPLIRYAIGDVTDKPLECPEVGFAYLSNISGRHQDLIIDKSGQPIYSGWFEVAIEHDDRIRCYQVHQRATGELVVSIELKTPQASLDKDRIRQVLTERSGFDTRVEVVEELPSTLAGKHRWITSDLAAEKNMKLPNWNLMLTSLNRE
jgi:phenylacetate-CoA ligase